MKTNLRQLLLVSFTLAACAVAFAAKPLAGPKGGKILTTDAPHAEFFVEKNRTVTITFYDTSLKPIPLTGQVVTGVAEAKTGKVGLEFSAKGGALVSNFPLPKGDDYTVVLQVRETASARPKVYRVQFHDEVCDECKRAEYACVCDDAGKEHEHDKKKE
ncbi:MAG: hypothetical protein Q7S40_04420 [Opitutaceae bacterium]|nr:hypothetical protein [Opitutaceae bacterium]